MLQLATDFTPKLKEQFNEAAENKHLLFNQKVLHHDLSTEINGKKYNALITRVSSLQHKPDRGTVENNPFAKPEVELTILDKFGPNDEYRLVFNKFPVTPVHFMMVTREFVSQNTPLSPEDLVSLFTVLKELKANDKEKKWFSFFNCGPLSGASQPHKHIQFMSLPDGFESFGDKLASTLEAFIPSLTREPLQDSNLSFAHFLAVIPEDLGSDEESSFTLAMIFLSLLQRTLTVLREHGCSHGSYNFVATSRWMMLMPRCCGKFAGVVGINSCGLMGLILTNRLDQFEVVKLAGWDFIQRHVGFPSTAGESSDQYHY